MLRDFRKHGLAGLFEDGSVMPLTVCNVNYNNFSFALGKDDGEFLTNDELTGLTKLTIALRDRQLIIENPVRNEAQGITSFGLSLNGTLLTLSRDSAFGRPSEWQARLFFNHNVACFFESAILAPDSRLVLKTLRGIAITPESGINGTIDVGYRTARSTSSIRSKGTRMFTFDELDFSDFSFETTAFAHVYVKPIFKKYFDFIQLRFGSTDNRPCGVCGLSIRYSVLKDAKGVK